MKDYILKPFDLDAFLKGAEVRTADDTAIIGLAYRPCDAQPLFGKVMGGGTETWFRDGSYHGSSLRSCDFNLRIVQRIKTKKLAVVFRRTPTPDGDHTSFGTIYRTDAARLSFADSEWCRAIIEVQVDEGDRVISPSQFEE